MDYWGKHLMINAIGCNLDTVRSRDTIAAFIEAVCIGIEMERYGDPVIEHFATHDPNAAGYTVMQMISTSSITAHFVDLNGDAYVDIFSCKDFDESIAVGIFKLAFSPKDVESVSMLRGKKWQSEHA